MRDLRDDVVRQAAHRLPLQLPHCGFPATVASKAKSSCTPLAQRMRLHIALALEADNVHVNRTLQISQVASLPPCRRVRNAAATATCLRKLACITQLRRLCRLRRRGRRIS